MTFDEFTERMTEFESSRKLGEEEREKHNREVRWRVAFRKLEKYTDSEFKSAIDTLLETNRFLPALLEIVEACEEAREASAPIKVPERRDYPREDHKCAKRKDPPSDALRQLAAIAPYEAAHVFCKGKIRATCPACGARHLDTAILEGIAKLFPAEQVKGWNHYFKGWTLCPDCEVKNG